jgi:hypothetical protein
MTEFERPAAERAPSALLTPAEIEKAEAIDATRLLLGKKEREAALPVLRGLTDRARDGTLAKDIERDIDNLPFALNAVSTNAKDALAGGVERDVLQSLSPSPMLQSNAKEIMKALRSPIPPKAQSGFTHRYVQGRERGKDSWYELRFDAIDTDLKDIERMQNAHPEARESFEALKNMLMDYGAQDRKYMAYKWQTEAKDTTTDATIMKMGGLGVVLLALTAAVGTGIVSLMNRRFPTTALLYAAVAGLIASPSLRHKLFAGKKENALTQIDIAVNPASAKKDIVDYHMAGRHWKRLAQELMNKPADDTNALLKKLATTKNDPSSFMGDVDAYAKRKMPGDEEAQANLRQMILDKRFASFASRMAVVKDSEAKQVVEAYFMKSSQLEYQALDAADVINDTEEALPAEGFPEAGGLGG